MRRLRAWLANPWGTPRWLRLGTIAYLVWSIVPLLIAIRFSFNEGRSRSTAQGFSTQWYWGDPPARSWDDPDLLGALRQSLKLALLAVIVTVPLGAALALGVTRWRARTAGANRTVAVPAGHPRDRDGRLAPARLREPAHLRALGTPAQAIGHITFSLTFVMIIVRGRLLSIGPEIEQAAQDLGATPLQAVRMALLPMLVPALVASAIMVFALSMDDFVVSAFLSSGTTTDTVPVRIYSNARGAPTPALNALASITLAVTLLIAALAFVVWRLARTRGGQSGSAVQDLAAEL